MSFAEISKFLRKKYNLSQEEFAKKAKISKSCVSMIEIGKNEPTSTTLLAYAKFFECSTDYLLGLEDDFGVINNKNEDSFLNKNERQLLYDFNELSPIRQEMLKEKISDWLEIEKLQKK